jgi:hypothetical protein
MSWWPFPKKKEALKPIKSRKFIEHTWADKEVGKAVIKYTLADGRKFHSTVYGVYCQECDFGEDYIRGKVKYVKDASISYEMTEEAIIVATRLIREINGEQVVTITDDSKDPMKAVTGKVVAAEIIKTQPFKAQVSFAFLESRFYTEE